MYGIREPLMDPGYFNFTSHTDVNRLAKVLETDIVIYFAHDNKFLYFELYHDFRGFTQTQQQQQQTPCLYYVVTIERKLFKFNQCLDQLFAECGNQYFFAETKSRLGHREDYGGLLARLLGLPPPNFAIPTLLDLAFSVGQLYSLWGQNIILVNFCKSNFNQKVIRNASRRSQPKYSYFFHLGLIAAPGSTSVAEIELDKFRVAVCFYANSFGCILKDAFRREVICQYNATSRRDKPSSNDFARLPVVSADEHQTALQNFMQKKEAKKQKNKS